MASAAAVAIVAFIAIAVVASIVFAQDPNNPTYGYVPKPLKTSASSTDSATGLTLGLSLSATTITGGQTLNVSASEYNAQPAMNNVTASSDWPLQGLSLGLCGTVNQPFGMAVFRGHYTRSNVSSAKALLLYQPYGVTSCPMILSEISQYSFYPHNSTAQIWGSCTPGPCQVLKVSSSSQTSGFWNAIPLVGSSYHSTFPPGVYTVAAGDEWGQLALLYFVVKA